MYRIPLINMHSRETNRLPVVEVLKKLGVAIDSELPLEIQRGITSMTSSGKYIIYILNAMTDLFPNDLGSKGLDLNDRFLLVEVNRTEETILDSGTVHCLRGHAGQRPYIDFHGRSKKIGYFAYYCEPHR